MHTSIRLANSITTDRRLEAEAARRARIAVVQRADETRHGRVRDLVSFVRGDRRGTLLRRAGVAGDL